ncbi:hypothetical protein [Paenibacillus sp. MMO-177]|uniref:hypothetical protein n=1 Tax=Paenibacillus sp. MMO-177 TaxID=3081289 RepID=UPI00301A0DC0
MSKWRKELPKAWFGWNMGDTEDYLRRLVALQNREADELEAAIRQDRRLNQELRLELELLGGHNPVPVPSDDDHYTAMFIERLDRSVAAVRLQGDKELASIELMIKEKEEEHVRRLVEMDEQFAEYEETLERLLQEAADWMKRLKAKIPGEEADNLVEKLRSELQKPVEAEEGEEISGSPSMARSYISVKHEAEQKFSEAVYESIRSAKVIQFRLHSILATVEAAASLNEAQAPQMTAVNQDQPTSSPPQMPRIVTRKVNPPTPSESSAFWGDLDPYLEPENIFEHVQPQIYTPAMQPADPEEALNVSSHVAAASARGQLEAGDVPVKTPTAEESLRVQENELESPALAQDIRFVQQRYIVGKIAGESLYDEAGKLVVAKGETITFDIVQRAEKAGKMPDLIVHMIIPGFGADVQ